MAENDLPTMPLVEHLRELRSRIIVSVVALVTGMVLALPLSPRVIQGLKSMCPVCQYQLIDPTEGFATYFRVALTVGLVLAVPVIVYESVQFVRPALYPHERRVLYLLLPGAALLFALGLIFGYLVVLPRTLSFLASFPSGWGESNWRLGSFIAFSTNLLVIVGVAFETPLVVFLATKLGILSPQAMSRYRRHAIVAMAILAAVLTPTPDPFTMLLVLAPMIILYELGGLLARIF